MKTTQEPSLFTEKEAAICIKMSTSFLRHARINGNRETHTPAPKFIKIGRSIRYPKEELEAWLAQFPRRTHLYETADEIVKHGGAHVSK